MLLCDDGRLSDAFPRIVNIDLRPPPPRARSHPTLSFCQDGGYNAVTVYVIVLARVFIEPVARCTIRPCVFAPRLKREASALFFTVTAARVPDGFLKTPSYYRIIIVYSAQLIRQTAVITPENSGIHSPGPRAPPTLVAAGRRPRRRRCRDKPPPRRKQQRQ